MANYVKENQNSFKTFRILDMPPTMQEIGVIYYPSMKVLENSAIAEPLGDSRDVVALMQIGKNFILSYLLKNNSTFTKKGTVLTLIIIFLRIKNPLRLQQLKQFYFCHLELDLLQQILQK
jgi:hypothetical protein